MPRTQTMNRLMVCMEIMAMRAMLMTTSTMVTAVVMVLVTGFMVNLITLMIMRTLNMTKH